MREAVDFHLVKPEHAEIDKRLLNWSRWANGRPHSIVQPMFQMYRPDNWDRELSGIPVDRLDAQRMQKGVAALPAAQRSALTWHYVAPCSPKRMAQSLGESLAGLAALVGSARTMLINRRI